MIIVNYNYGFKSYLSLLNSTVFLATYYRKHDSKKPLKTLRTSTMMRMLRASRKLRTLKALRTPTMLQMLRMPTKSKTQTTLSYFLHWNDFLYKDLIVN
jgi:predicted butyrate kinase (DUF1464 family)